MDSASFATVWFWLALIGAWSLAGRAVLGVPVDVISRARQDPHGRPGMVFLDWMSLCLPRWQLPGREGAWLLGLSAFVLTSLITMGFAYDLELAQALSLLALPFAIVFIMRVFLAKRLVKVMQTAQSDSVAAGEAADRALRIIRVHRVLVTIVSMLAIAVTALWATIFSLLHPHGF